MTRVAGDWLDAPGTQAVMAMLERGGHQALAVGGAVRNALLGRAVDDVDIATDARPDRVIALAEAAGLNPVPTGIDHGTVTVVAHGTGYEVTTFRADVETDGRHAKVRFSDTLADDAARRDFTMNALYADRQGTVVDPLGGLPDLRAGRVRFIGDAARRIAEDYLRILRFFRFTAWYGDPALGLDADALAAIAGSLDGLARLSRERVLAEVMRLAAAPDPAPALAAMRQTGVLAALLPGTDPGAIAPLVHLEQAQGCAPDACRRLAALGLTGAEDLRYSRADAKALSMRAALIGAEAGLAEIAWRHGAPMARDIALLRAAFAGTDLHPDTEAEIETGAAARFPVSAADLMPEYKGAALGARLRELENRWIASGFSLTRAELLN